MPWNISPDARPDRKAGVIAYSSHDRSTRNKIRSVSRQVHLVKKVFIVQRRKCYAADRETVSLFRECRSMEGFLANIALIDQRSQMVAVPLLMYKPCSICPAAVKSLLQLRRHK